MDINVEKLLIDTIRSAVTGEKFDLVIDEDVAKSLYDIADIHDLAHLVALGLSHSGALIKTGEIGANFTTAQTRAIFRHVKIVKELTDMATSLERHGVDFIFLKGSKLRFYYPEPWMRTSSDIDVFVKAEHIAEAKKVLSGLGYKYSGEWRYECRYDTPSGVHVEMHTDICDDDERIDEYLKTVWDTAILEDGYSHKYRMGDDMFLFYHVAHMAKHFGDGGCGIRPFVDLYVLSRRGEPKEDFYRMTEGAGLSDFYVSAKALTEYWFGSGDVQAVPQNMREFVIRGGLFGTYENAVSIGGGGGKFRYVMRRIFPVYRDMKDNYPILKKCCILLPFCYVLRWFSLLGKALRGKGRDEIKAIKGMNADKVQETKELFEKLGLRQS